jgi:hypothetical protein
MTWFRRQRLDGPERIEIDDVRHDGRRNAVPCEYRCEKSGRDDQELRPRQRPTHEHMLPGEKGRSFATAIVDDNRRPAPCRDQNRRDRKKVPRPARFAMTCANSALRGATTPQGRRAQAKQHAAAPPRSRPVGRVGTDDRRMALYVTSGELARLIATARRRRQRADEHDWCGAQRPYAISPWPPRRSRRRSSTVVVRLRAAARPA